MQGDVFLVRNDTNKLLKQRAYKINKHSKVITHIVWYHVGCCLLFWEAEMFLDVVLKSFL